MRSGLGNPSSAVDSLPNNVRCQIMGCMCTFVRRSGALARAYRTHRNRADGTCSPVDVLDMRRAMMHTAIRPHGEGQQILRVLRECIQPSGNNVELDSSVEEDLIGDVARAHRMASEGKWNEYTDGLVDFALDDRREVASDDDSSEHSLDDDSPGDCRCHMCVAFENIESEFCRRPPEDPLEEIFASAIALVSDRVAE